jgi:putative ABC transport system ATP-binding protein
VLEVFANQVRRSGAAAVLVTHSEVAAAVADRTLILARSGLIERHGR